MGRGRHRRSGPVRVEGKGVRVRETAGDVGVEHARRRFGGLDLPASLAGMLCALGMAVLLAGLATGAGSVGYQRGLRGDRDTVSFGGFIAGLVILLVAFLVGGWVAGRMARYDGARNGLMAAVWFLLLAAVVAVLGAWAGDKYDFFADVNLPQWFTRNARTAGAIASGIAAVAVMLLAGMAGGKLGARYHRRADDLIARTRPGGIVSGDPTVIRPASEGDHLADGARDGDRGSRAGRADAATPPPSRRRAWPGDRGHPRRGGTPGRHHRAGSRPGPGPQSR
jgi:hypothetical protein